MTLCRLCGSASLPTFRKDGLQFHRCRGCRLEFIDPQPDDAALAKTYDDGYFDAWGRATEERLVREMKRRTFRRLLKILGKPCGRLLDGGAATGHLAELAQEIGWEAYAAELAPFGARACAERLGGDRTFQGKIEDARFKANPENRFEAITLIDVIEHVRDPRQILRWGREHLVEGGQMLIVTPSAGSLGRRVMGRFWHHFHEEHLWYLNPANAARLLREAGFTSLRILPAAKSIMPVYGATCLMKQNRRWLNVFLRIGLKAFPRSLTCSDFTVPTGDMMIWARAGQGTR